MKSRGKEDSTVKLSANGHRDFGGATSSIMNSWSCKIRAWCTISDTGTQRRNLKSGTENQKTNLKGCCCSAVSAQGFGKKEFENVHEEKERSTGSVLEKGVSHRKRLESKSCEEKGCNSCASSYVTLCQETRDSRQGKTAFPTQLSTQWHLWPIPKAQQEGATRRCNT